MANGLHVVDDRRFQVETQDGRKIGRFDPRIRALSLERFKQAGLLAADVCACPLMDININVKARIQNIFADEALCPSGLDRVPNNACGLGKLAPDVNVAKVRIRRISRNGESLDELMRVVVKNISVLEGSRFGLVGVDHDIVRFAIIIFDEAPLCAAGKSRSSAAAQIGGLNGVHDLRGLHGHGLAKRFIAAMSEIGLDRGIVARLADVLKDDASLLRMRRRHDKGLPAH